MNNNYDVNITCTSSAHIAHDVVMLTVRVLVALQAAAVAAAAAAGMTSLRILAWHASIQVRVHVPGEAALRPPAERQQRERRRPRLYTTMD